MNKQVNKQGSKYRFFDLQPEITDFHTEIIRGLGSTPRFIPPKFFYDERGSQLFADICKTEEYYPTRTESAIIRDNLEEIVQQLGSDCLLVEPGSGESAKVRQLLEVLRPFAYLPMDISSDFLQQEAQKLAAEFPWLDVHAVCTDFTTSMTLPYTTEEMQRVAFFPGSTIGNFEPEDAETFLRDIACMVGNDGGLLIGVDLVKSDKILNAAYNDAAGVTAAFNLNLLRRINRELGANFTLDQFAHKAFFNREKSRIEMHIVSKVAQQVSIADCCFEFAAGETIHTENSHKYTIEDFQAMARRAGFEPVKVWTDAEKLFSLQFFKSSSEERTESDKS
ncbi:MAG: L-histidine N(alpha)-methyltransferase [Pseudomonadota bacterium]|nr:L-histidine N(alpha)-methyltransferase [Pseudomonadota bacterium]